MPTMDLTKIDVGGPCKVIDPNGTIYFDEGVTLTPNPVYRPVSSSVAGEGDDTLIGLTYTLKGRPKSVWTAPYRATLLPPAYTNWSTSGGRICGTSNRSVAVVGSDSKGFTLTRSCVDKMPSLFCGLGEALYDEVEWIAFIGTGKALTDTDAFYVENTTAWDQSDYPTTHQEAMCTAAWGAVTGWDTVFAEKGFKLSHEFKTHPVMSGNNLVDKRVNSYRAMMAFLPQQPTTTQLLDSLKFQGASAGLGTRRSANAFDMVVAGSGLSVTGKSMAANKGSFVFDNKANRPGEWGMITSLATPGTRLTLA